jgi:hypothetical protein
VSAAIHMQSKPSCLGGVQDILDELYSNIETDYNFQNVTDQNLNFLTSYW